MRVGGFRSGDDLLARRPRIAISDVFFNRGGEEQRLLHHNADLAAQAVQVDISHINAVNGHAPGGDVIEAGYEVRDRRLSGAGEPDDGDDLARLGFKIDVIHDRMARAAILRADIFKADVTANLGRDGVAPVYNQVFFIEHLEDALAARYRLGR